MVINALSDDTVRLLGSPTVIATPVDLVKELLDNAIDAKATSVEILVAPNLVDRIEVRDDGHGIPEEDHDSLGRNGHTSKITSFHELPALGNTTLGFRGQALASATSLGNVIVTTRTSGDPTATSIKLKAGHGGTDSKQRVSAPFGTTVSVTGLYSNLPVRARTAAKEAPKNISKIKQLLQGYVLARPGLRLSFKCRGGDTKWSYAPRPQATVREAVIQVFGTEVMSQCMIRTICSAQDDGETESLQDNEKTSIQAVLPSEDADLGKISNKGAFFSVDSRPQTTSRGTMKSLLKVFKSYLWKALSENGSQNGLRDPFICVNIRCLPGSYDPNVEPSKNQVLFADESRLVELFERLCTDVYRTQHASNNFVTLETRRLLPSPRTETSLLRSDGPIEEVGPGKQTFPLELGRQTATQDSNVMMMEEVNSSPLSRPERPQEICSGGPKQRPTMHSSQFPRPRSSSKSAYTSAAPVRHHAQAIPQQEHLDELTIAEAEDVDIRQPSDLDNGVAAGRTTIIAQKSVQHHSLDKAPGDSISGNLDLPSDEEAEILAARFRGRPPSRSQARDCGRVIKPRDPWNTARNIASGQQLSSHTHSTTRPHAPPTNQRPGDPFDDLPILQPSVSLGEDFRSARTVNTGSTHTAHHTYLPSIVSHSTLGHNIDANLALRPMHGARPEIPSNGKHPCLSHRSNDRNMRGSMRRDGLVQTTISFAGTNLPQKLRAPPAQLHIDDVLSRSDPPYRKPWKTNHKDSGPNRPQKPPQTQEVHEVYYRLGQAETDETKSLSHRHGAHEETYTVCQPSDHTLESSSTSLLGSTDVDENQFEADSRKYLMRRQRFEADHRRSGRPMLKRAKSDMLPFETVPDTYQTQHLVLTVTPDLEKPDNTPNIAMADYGVDGDIFANTGFSERMGLQDAAEIEPRLRSLLGEWAKTTLGQELDLDINIGALVKGKTAAA